MIDAILKLSRTAGVNSEQYGLWGKTAAKRYLEDGVPLNTTIQKIASEESLNANEISRVCEMANLETYANMLKTSSPHDKSFEFPVADKAAIVSSGGEKTAMPNIFTTDFDRPLDKDLTKVAGLDIFEAFGVSGIEKVAEDGARAEGLLQKLERLAELEKDKIAMNLEKSVETAEKFVAQMKQELLKGKSFDEVQAAVYAKAEQAKDPAHADRLRELVNYAKRQFHDMGLVQTPARTGDGPPSPTNLKETDEALKTAEPVEEDLVTDAWESPGVAVSVVNGRHPLFASIDTLVTQFEEADKSRHNLIILEDKIRYTKNRIYGKKQPL